MVVSLFALTGCDLLLGPIGALSQIHKSLQYPWVVKRDVFWSTDVGWTDHAKAQFVEKNGVVYLVVGMQYSALTRQDIAVLHGLDTAIQVEVIESNQWSPYLDNIFDITAFDTGLAMVYRSSNSSFIRTWDILNRVPTTYNNSNYYDQYLFYPSQANDPYGLIGGGIYYVGKTGGSVNFLQNLPGMTNYIPVKSFYMGSQFYLAYIAPDIYYSNRVYIYNVTTSSPAVQGFPHHLDGGTSQTTETFDIAGEPGGPIYYLGDFQIFEYDGSSSLIPQDFQGGSGYINTSGPVSGFIKNGQLHYVFMDGISLQYRLVDLNSKTTILYESMADISLEGNISALDVFVDSKSRVYIAIMEHRSLEDRTFVHLMYR